MLTSSTLWLLMAALAMVLGILSVGPALLFTQATVCAGVAAILMAIESRDV